METFAKNNKWKIIFTFRHLHWNGGAGCVLRLAEELRILGHDVFLICEGGSEFEKRALSKGLNICGHIRFNEKINSNGFYQESKKLSKILTQDKFDFIQTNGPNDMVMVADALDYIKTSKIIRVIHTSRPIVLSETNTKIFSQFLDVVIVEYKDAIQNVLGQLIKNGFLKPENVFVSHGTFDQRELTSKLITIQKYTNKKLFAYVGRLEKEKGIYFLIEAIYKIRHRNDFELWIAGVGSENENLRKLIMELGLDNKIKILGFIEDISLIMSQIDFLILPSIGCDASSTVIKEAMFYGKPSIATKIGGIEEMITNKENGLIIHPGSVIALSESIDFLLDNDQLVLSMGMKCKNVVMKFTPHIQALDFEKKYKKLKTET